MYGAGCSMTYFRSLRRWILVSRAFVRSVAGGCAVVLFVRPPVGLRSGMFWALHLLLVALGRGLLDFPIGHIHLISCSSLSLGRTPRVQESWLAICAMVNIGNLSLMIVTFDMLPGLTLLAENSATIVVLKITDAFDREILFHVCRKAALRQMVCVCGRDKGADERIDQGCRLGGMRRGKICHNMTENALL